MAMGLLSKLMGRPEMAEPEAEPAPANCTHLVLVPRWDSVDDIGHEDRATSFRCEACGSEFSPAEARSLQSSEGERLRDVVPAEEGEA
jgi:hypothetical protein